MFESEGVLLDILREEEWRRLEGVREVDAALYGWREVDAAEKK